MLYHRLREGRDRKKHISEFHPSFTFLKIAEELLFLRNTLRNGIYSLELDKANNISADLLNESALTT